MKTLRPIGHILPRTSPLQHSHSLRTQHLITPTNHNRQHLHRTFLTNPFSSSNNTPQTISASRTLPYNQQQIFAVISDVESYSHYFPFCLESVVTKYSQPASNGQRYPEEAKLVVGYYRQASEEFWSRIYCVPESTVEAVSGNTETALSAQSVRHHNSRPPGAEDRTRDDTVLSHLLTRWDLRSLDEMKTEVRLRIEVQFTSPLYAALSQAAVPKVAERMIEAFEQRLEEVAKSSPNSA